MRALEPELRALQGEVAGTLTDPVAVYRIVDTTLIPAVVRVRACRPVGRTGSPEEVGEAAVWLCSEAASFVTGHAMAVDGAYVAR